MARNFKSTYFKTGEWHTGDCFDAMRYIPDQSIDMILCDLPYGTTICAWDTILPFPKLWKEYQRICNGNIILTGTQPFTSALIMSNIKNFKYTWIWNKHRPSNPMQAKRRVLKIHEDVCVFYTRSTTYNPQGVFETDGRPRGGVKASTSIINCGDNLKAIYRQTKSGYPKSIIPFALDNKRIHPTQKPVALFEYMIKTYSNPGDIILDNTAGSGTLAIAAINAKRYWVGIEKDKVYASKAIARIRNHERSIFGIK